MAGRLTVLPDPLFDPTLGQSIALFVGQLALILLAILWLVIVALLLIVARRRRRR